MCRWNMSRKIAGSRISQSVQVVLPNAIVAKVERLAVANRDSVSHFIRRIIMAEIDTYHISSPRPKRTTAGGVQ